MQFQTYGPFEVPVGKNGLIDHSNDAKKEFWKAVEENEEGLSATCGCYIYAVKAPNGQLPWYVGRTTKRIFKTECLNAFQVNYYNQALAKRSRIVLQLFLLPKLTPKSRFAKPSQNKHLDIEFLESYLIGLALNPKSRQSFSRACQCPAF